MARSRTPLRVVGSGVSSSRWASTWLSQLPVRVPAEGTPLTLATPAASCESSRPLSAASLARARMAESFWLMVEGARPASSSRAR
jgi:hypothetical protein